MNRRFPGLALLLMLCLLQGPVFADRPLITEDTYTVGPGTLKLEIGLDWSTLPESRTMHARGGLLTFGLRDSLDLLVGKSDVLNLPIEGGSVNGTCDSLAGFKYRFQNEAGSRPAMALRVLADLNDGDARAGTGKTELALDWIALRQCGKTTLHANAGCFLSDPASGFTRGDLFNYSLAAERPISGKLTVVGEIIGVSSPSRPASAMAQVGLTWQLSPSITLDAGWLNRLNDHTLPRSNLTIGAAIAF
jgi:hypothetical protein